MKKESQEQINFPALIGGTKEFEKRVRHNRKLEWGKKEQKIKECLKEQLCPIFWKDKGIFYRCKTSLKRKGLVTPIKKIGTCQVCKMIDDTFKKEGGGK